MTTITITPQYVNPPREGGKWGNIKDENGTIFRGPWPIVSQAKVGAPTELDVEVEYWKDTKNNGPDVANNVVKAVRQPGQLALAQPTPPQPVAAPVQAAPIVNGQYVPADDPFAGMAHELPVPTPTPQAVPAPHTAVPLSTTPTYSANGARIGMFFNLMKESHIQGVDLPDDEQLLGWYKWAQGMSAKLDG